MHEDPKARALATLGALSLYFSGILETHWAFASVVLVAAFFFCSQRMCKVFELREDIGWLFDYFWQNLELTENEQQDKKKF